MPYYVCGLDCSLVRNNPKISEKNPVSGIFVSGKNLPLKKNHICRAIWIAVVVPENLILFLHCKSYSHFFSKKYQYICHISRLKFKNHISLQLR